jgi:hypothetical protein
MRIAFDCQGVLLSDGPTPQVLETRTRGKIMPDLLETLVRGGAKVFCISAAPEGHPLAYEALVRLLALHEIPVHGIFPVFHAPGETPYCIGRRKALAMRHNQCVLIFDDVPEVCRGIRDAGQIAVEYSTAWEACL